MDTKGHRQRLKKQFLENPDSFDDAKILELLLTYSIPQKDIKKTAEGLIKHFGSITEVLVSDFEKLTKFNDIKDNSATLLKLVEWIRKKYPIKKKETKETVKDKPQISLFDEKPGTIKLETEKTILYKEPRQNKGLFANAILDEAIRVLPFVDENKSYEENRVIIRGHLKYNSEESRVRYADYILKRMFPKSEIDNSLVLFSREFKNLQPLRDIVFYHFCKAETLITKIISELLLPSIGQGFYEREKLQKFLEHSFPGYKSVSKCTAATIDALTTTGIARSDKKKFYFGYRDISIESFAYILHSEFAEHGIHSFYELINNQYVQSMFWNPDKIVPALYELRNLSLISKVSEIDNIKQFTLKYSLKELVREIIKKV